MSFIKKLRRLLERIALALESIARSRLIFISGGELRFSGLTGENMFIVPNDQPDVPFVVSPISATDAENENIPLTESLVSDDGEVISLVFNEGSSESNPREGVAKVGHSGVANVNYTAKDANGNIVKSSGAQFTVTTGAIANVSGGEISFQGIEES